MSSSSNYISSKKRQNVKKRAKGHCEYCLSQEDFSPDFFSIEHIIPKVKGGSNDIDNLALSCQGCNNLKFTRTEVFDDMTNEMTNLYHPRLDIWEEHFKWSDNKMKIIPISAKGRVTTQLLQLNRFGVTNLRRALKAIGEHPPKL